jgi:hypothetical protein
MGILANADAEEISLKDKNTQELLHVQNPFMDVLGKESYIGVILKDKRHDVYLPKCSDGRVIYGEFDSPEKAYNAILSKCI